MTTSAATSNSSGTTLPPLVPPCSDYDDCLKHYGFLPRDQDPGWAAALAVLGGIIIVLSVLGNSLILALIARYKTLRSVTHIFLASMAVSDLLLALLNLPFQLKQYESLEWTIGGSSTSVKEFTCKFTPYIQGVTLGSGVFTLTAISLDRYYAICHPLKSLNVRSSKRAFIIVAILWTASFVLFIPHLIINVIIERPKFDSTTPDPDWVTVCVEDFQDTEGSKAKEIAFNVYYYIVVYVGPLIIITTAYILIGCKLWGRRRVFDMQCAAVEARNMKQKKKVIRMLIVVVVYFAASWFPFHILHILNREGHIDFYNLNHRKVYAFLQLIGYSNCFINAILYTLLNDNFKTHVKMFFRCSKHGSETNASRSINPNIRTIEVRERPPETNSLVPNKLSSDVEESQAYM